MCQNIYILIYIYISICTYLYITMYIMIDEIGFGLEPNLIYPGPGRSIYLNDGEAGRKHCPRGGVLGGLVNATNLVPCKPSETLPKAGGGCRGTFECHNFGALKGCYVCK